MAKDGPSLFFRKERERDSQCHTMSSYWSSPLPLSFALTSDNMNFSVSTILTQEFIAVPNYLKNKERRERSEERETLLFFIFSFVRFTLNVLP